MADKTITPYGSNGQAADGLGIINSLNAQAAGNALDAYQGARLKAQIDYVYARLQAVYAALGDIAFWDGKPASATILPNLDWGMPKHTLTLNLTLSNASVKINGTAYSNGDTLSVEEYSTLSVLIEAASGYTFASAPTLSFGGTSVTLTANQDGSYSADVVMGQSDATMAVSATAVASYSISYGTLSHCSATTAPTSIISGNQATIVFGVDSGYRLAQNGISVTNASIVSYDASTGTLVIGNASGNVTISATAALLFKLLLGHYIDGAVLSRTDPMDSFIDGSVAGNEIYYDGVNVAANYLLSDYVKLPQLSSISSATVDYGVGRSGANSSGDPPCCLVLFRKEQGGTFTVIYCKTVPLNNDTSRTIDSSTLGSESKVVVASQAGTLYARFLVLKDGNAVKSGCKFVWNGSTIFNTSSNYLISTDPDEFAAFYKDQS